MATSGRRRVRRKSAGAAARHVQRTLQPLLDQLMLQSGALLKRGKKAFGARPRTSLAAAGLVALGLGFMLVPGGPEGTPAARVQPLELPAANLQDQAESSTAQAANALLNGYSNQDDEHEWQVVEIKPGQTLEQVFRQLGLSAGLLHQVAEAARDERDLARIRPGDQFAFNIDADTGFQALRTELDEAAWLFVEQTGEGLQIRTEPRDLDRRIVEKSGIVTSSLYRDAVQAGLSDVMIMRLADIFGWDIDFALDIRSGDHFALVYEEVWRDGEHLRDGDILAARFVNRSQPFEALRFDAGNGADYFAPDGRPMRKAFLRTPLNFTRVSSNFNPRRLHPVNGQVRPHNGTDYAAPTGTPVWASGDGKIIEAGYTQANGNYIFIQHGNSIVTKYLHLSKKLVKRGERVRQGQTIGRVGATGWATGPHLHYEFLVNGVHRNPRTVDLPQADPLPRDQMESFSQLGDVMLARLDRLTATRTLLAGNHHSDDCSAVSSSC